VAYDLFYKKQIPFNCSRNPDAGPLLNAPTAVFVSAGLVVMLKGIFAKIHRAEEQERYQREFRPGHHPTMELPACELSCMRA